MENKWLWQAFNTILVRKRLFGNADLVPLVMDGVDNINLDISDSGQLFNALSSYSNIPELKLGEDIKSVKAVVHLAKEFYLYTMKRFASIH